MTSHDLNRLKDWLRERWDLGRPFVFDVPPGKTPDMPYGGRIVVIAHSKEEILHFAGLPYRPWEKDSRVLAMFWKYE